MYRKQYNLIKCDVILLPQNSKITFHFFGSKQLLQKMA